MVNTRTNSSSDPQPPPVPANLAEVLAQQTKILRLIVAGQQNQQQQGHRQHHPNVATYSDFLATQPPLFNKAEEPLDADAWIHTIESKFPLLTAQCSEENKARFAAQQLRGPARLWWDNLVASLPANAVIAWDEFKAAFRAHHIPDGLLERKLNEFLALKQGDRSVLQYAQQFNHLSQYASYHVDTDQKKQACFRRGLSPKLKDRLAVVRPVSYNELVNLAIS